MNTKWNMALVASLMLALGGSAMAEDKKADAKDAKKDDVKKVEAKVEKVADKKEMKAEKKAAKKMKKHGHMHKHHWCKHVDLNTMKMEKCQLGALIKAHKSDCSVGCSGGDHRPNANEAGDCSAWIWLPQGSCDKIEGGVVVH